METNIRFYLLDPHHIHFPRERLNWFMFLCIIGQLVALSVRMRMATTSHVFHLLFMRDLYTRKAIQWKTFLWMGVTYSPPESAAIPLREGVKASEQRRTEGKEKEILRGKFGHSSVQRSRPPRLFSLRVMKKNYRIDHSH